MLKLENNLLSLWKFLLYVFSCRFLLYVSVVCFNTAESFRRKSLRKLKLIVEMLKLIVETSDFLKYLFLINLE